MTLSVKAQMFEQMKTWGTLTYGPRVSPWPVPLWVIWAWVDLRAWERAS